MVRKNVDMGYQGVERRKHRRIKKNFIASFRFEDTASGGESSMWNMVTLLNLSAGGALFNFTELIPQGSALNMKINFPAFPDPLKCTGTVLRVEEPSHSLISRIAVRFTDIKDDAMGVINRTADELFEKNPGRIES